MIISVVTITFNNFQELQKTLFSLKEVSASLFEILVINGGSCLETKNYLETVFQDEFPQGYFISEKDDGIADAFNKGFALAKGDALMYLNSGDVLWDKNYLAQCIETFKENPSLGFIHSSIIFADEMAGEILMRPRGKLGDVNLGRGMPFFHQSMVVKKDVFQQLGLFKTQYRYAMDYEFVLRLFKHKIEGLELSGPVVWMDGSGVSVKQEKKSIFECQEALKRDNLYFWPVAFGFYQRLMRYYVRRVLLILRIDFIIRLYKRKKSCRA